jgi:hypothetical protein
VVNKQDYISQVNIAVSQLHNCGAAWVKTVPVHEVFDLYGNPKAKRAYAWSYLDGDKDERTRFVAVLEIPPVVSTETAVRFKSSRTLRRRKTDLLF